MSAATYCSATDCDRECFARCSTLERNEEVTSKSELPSENTWRVWDSGSGRVYGVRSEEQARNIQRQTRNTAILRPGQANPAGAAQNLRQGVIARIVDAALRRMGK